MESLLHFCGEAFSRIALTIGPVSLSGLRLHSRCIYWLPVCLFFLNFDLAPNIYKHGEVLLIN